MTFEIWGLFLDFQSSHNILSMTLWRIMMHFPYFLFLLVYFHIQKLFGQYLLEWVRNFMFDFCFVFFKLLNL